MKNIPIMEHYYSIYNINLKHTKPIPIQLYYNNKFNMYKMGSSFMYNDHCLLNNVLPFSQYLKKKGTYFTKLEKKNEVSNIYKSIMIGILAGLPAALAIQTGMLSSMKKRGILTKKGLPGIEYAIFRDFLYLSGTQYQIQNYNINIFDRFLTIFLTTLAPIPFDTLSVISTDPKFKGLSHYSKNSKDLLHKIFPPQAIIGRIIWIPAYNWAYCKGQHTLGENIIGMIAGSILASTLCYPLFMIKTNLLLMNNSSNVYNRQARKDVFQLMKDILESYKITTGYNSGIIGFTNKVRYSYKGYIPHMIANLGPDCICMGFASMIFSKIYNKA